MIRKINFRYFSLIVALILFLARCFFNELDSQEMYLLNFGLILKNMRLGLVNCLLLLYDVVSVYMAMTDAEEIRIFLWIRKVNCYQLYLAFFTRFMQYFLPFMLVHLILFNSVNLLVSLINLLVLAFFWQVFVSVEFIKKASGCKKILIWGLFITFRVVISQIL